MSWEEHFCNEMTNGMKNHYRRLIKDNEWHKCPQCGFGIGRYPGRYPKTCPNCGAKTPSGAPSVELPKGKDATVVDNRAQTVLTIDRICESISAAYPEVPWSPSRKVLRLEAVDGRRCLFAVYDPCVPSRVAGTFVKNLSEVAALELTAEVHRILEARTSGDSLSQTGPNLAHPHTASGIASMQGDGGLRCEDEPLAEFSKDLHSTQAKDLVHGDLIAGWEDEKGYHHSHTLQVWRVSREGDTVVVSDYSGKTFRFPATLTLYNVSAGPDHKMHESAHPDVVTFVYEAAEQEAPQQPNLSQGPRKVFVYGTLTDPEIRRKALGKDVPFDIAQIEGFVLANETDGLDIWPTIRTSAKDNVKGLVLQVTDEDLNNLDAHEAGHYVRTVIPLRGELVFTYAWKSPVTEKLVPIPSTEADPLELKVGIEVEKEHTDFSGQASAIARQHLREDPHYYEHLWKAGMIQKDEVPEGVAKEAEEKWGKMGKVECTFKPAPLVNFVPCESLGGSDGPADATAEPPPGGQSPLAQNDINPPQKEAVGLTPDLGVTPPATPPTGNPQGSGPMREEDDEEEAEKDVAEAGKRVCAWCGLDMGLAPDLKDGEVTHGMCQACYDKTKAEILKIKAQKELKVESLEHLPLDVDWFSPDGGFSKIWLRSASGVVFFWFRDGRWTKQDYPAGDKVPGEQISASHPKVRDIIRRYFISEAAEGAETVPVDNPSYQGQPTRAKDKGPDEDVEESTEPQKQFDKPELISVVDTREWDWAAEKPIPGSGQANTCDRCTKQHEVIWQVRDVYGRVWAVGGSCGKKLWAGWQPADEDIKRLTKLATDEIKRKAMANRTTLVAAALAALEASLKTLFPGFRRDTGRNSWDTTNFSTNDGLVRVQSMDLSTSAQEYNYIALLAYRWAHTKLKELLKAIRPRLTKEEMEKATKDIAKRFKETFGKEIATAYAARERYRQESVTEKKHKCKELTKDELKGTKQFKHAIAVIRRGDEILMGVATQDDDRHGKWCFPAGHIDDEDGGDPIQAAKREAYEETGLEFMPTGEIVVHPDFPKAAFVVGTSSKGEPRPNFEFSAMQWIHLSVLDDFPDVFYTCRDAVERLELKEK